MSADLPEDLPVMPDLVHQWWSWVLGTPVGRNPVTDPTGARAGVGQPDGPVWLVAGAMSDSVRREWTMPAGRRLFLPVLCVVTVPWLFLGRSPRLDITHAQATLDGVELDLTPVMVRKLPVAVVPGNPFVEAEEAAEVRISTSGLWTLSEPLEPGEHDLAFGGETADGFQLQVACRIDASGAR